MYEMKGPEMSLKRDRNEASREIDRVVVKKELAWSVCSRQARLEQR